LLATLADYSSDAVREARALGAIVPSASECSDALEWLLRPVFICGHHRSGTTLLQNLLDGHPQLLVLPSEGTYFSSFRYVARRAPSELSLNRFAAEWIARCVDPNFAPHFRLGISDATRVPAVEFARALFGWHEALRTRVAPEFAALLALVAAYRATASPACAPQGWVEKTPRNERFAELFASFTAARFIQVVRDPRSVLASLGELSRAHGSFDAATSARTIGESLRCAAQNSRTLDERYLVVRYEDLVDRRAEQMERVREFLGVDAGATLLEPTAGRRPVAANSSFGAPTAVKSDRALPPAQLALLSVYAADAARPFGYDLPALGALVGCRTRLRSCLHRIWRAVRRHMRRGPGPQ
jgi:hypothetical protein